MQCTWQICLGYCFDWRREFSFSFSFIHKRGKKKKVWMNNEHEMKNGFVSRTKMKTLDIFTLVILVIGCFCSTIKSFKDRSNWSALVFLSFVFFLFVFVVKWFIFGVVTNTDAIVRNRSRFKSNIHWFFSCQFRCSWHSIHISVGFFIYFWTQFNIKFT